MEQPMKPLLNKRPIPSNEELETMMAERHTPEIHRILKNASVAIAGLGGLGSTIAIALARLGVGNLILVDFDVVDVSNLNRQQYFVDQVGLKKSDALASILSRINPTVTCSAHALRLTPKNIPSLFQSCPVIVEAFDVATEKAMLIETVLRALPDTKIVAASGMAGFGSANEIHTRRLGANLYLCGDEKTEAQPDRGLMAPRVGVAAHHQATMVLRLLLGEDTP